MRKFMLALPLLATLAGCATGTSPAPTNVDIIKAVRDAAVATCGFLPDAVTVGNIILAGNPAFVTASAIATAICAAVNNLPKTAMRRGAAVPTVAGVPIHGRFVR